MWSFCLLLIVETVRGRTLKWLMSAVPESLRCQLSTPSPCCLHHRTLEAESYNDLKERKSSQSVRQKLLPSNAASRPQQRVNDAG